MDLKLPQLGEGADSGTVVNLLVKEGDRIAVDQPVLELESEKAVATIPATASGTVTKIFVKTGEKISVGQKILSLSGGEAPAQTASSAAKGKSPGPEPVALARETESAKEMAAAGPEPVPGAPPAASPAIRKLARELGIDLARVRGTARGGRVVMTDLRAYVQRLQKIVAQPKTAMAAPVGPQPGQIDFSRWGRVTRKKLSPLREVIARRMARNWNAIPHVTQFDEADITALLALRKSHLEPYERKGARLTVTAFLLKAVADTLRRHPLFNSSFDEVAQEVVFKEYYHLGVAVDTEAGLIVPVIRDVDQKNLLHLCRELEELAARARDRKVTGDELKGGTFTISNQGGIGGAHFTPIINQPEVAILGVGRSAAKAVVRNGQVEVRTLLPLALSYDHRMIDGGQAARFIVDLVKAVEGFEARDVALQS